MTETAMALPRNMYLLQNFDGSDNIDGRTTRIEDFLRRKIEDLCGRLKSEIATAFKRSGASDTDRQTFIREVRDCVASVQSFVDELGREASSDRKPSLPTEAPAFWLEREDRKETPTEFIKREYAPWLGHGLTQAHILHLDKPLYTALHKWLRWNTLPDWLDLPTRKQMNDRLLEKQGVPTASESWGKALRDADAGTKERIRLYNIARKRARASEHQP